MLSKTYFFHYRAGSSPATIAFEVDQIHGVVIWDATFCSSKDQFSKEMGRSIALKRLHKNLIRSTYNYFSYDKAINIRDIRWKIVDMLSNHPDCPDSFRTTIL